MVKICRKLFLRPLILKVNLFITPKCLFFSENFFVAMPGNFRNGPEGGMFVSIKTSYCRIRQYCKSSQSTKNKNCNYRPHEYNLCAKLLF